MESMPFQKRTIKANKNIIISCLSDSMFVYKTAREKMSGVILNLWWNGGFLSEFALTLKTNII